MLSSLLLACASSPTATPPAEVEPAASVAAPAPTARPARPALPVALYVTHGGAAVPLGGVPAAAPGDAARAVEGDAVARWPSEGVEAATPEESRHRFTGWEAARCDPSGERTGAAVMDAPPADGALLVAPGGWSDGLVRWPTEPADDDLLRALSDGGFPTDAVSVASAGDLDGDGQPDRLVFASGPQVDPDKPAASTVLWWGADLAPLPGFDLNGAVEASLYLPTPAGPLVLLRSQWMGGSGAHLLVVEDSRPRALGEWICGT